MFSKVCWYHSAMFCLIFTEGDWIKSRLSSLIFSTLLNRTGWTVIEYGNFQVVNLWIHARYRAYQVTYQNRISSIAQRCVLPFPFRWIYYYGSKISFFLQCSKMLLIPHKKFNIQTCFSQYLGGFRLKCWLKGQIISRIHYQFTINGTYFSTLICFLKLLLFS